MNNFKSQTSKLTRQINKYFHILLLQKTTLPPEAEASATHRNTSKAEAN